MNLLSKIKKLGLVKISIDSGGSIHPLFIDSNLTGGTGLMNPSVYIDNGRIIVNIRHVNYTLYHSENSKFQHKYGPLQYIHPENEMKLKTWNYFAELNSDLTIKYVKPVDTRYFDIPPVWDFHGLEDARLFRWDGKLFMSGVRRDVKDNGEGRMELSEIEERGTRQLNVEMVDEINRVRIPAPRGDNTYCEKNWMPIIDQPYHYVKWSNPTEVVRFDPDAKTIETVYLDESKFIQGLPDLRGSSHVIPYGDKYIALVHEVNLFKSELGAKDGNYLHRFLVWDRNWNLLKVTDSFSFMKADIEFCCGATFYDNSLLLSFGFQDNCAFILKMPLNLLNDILEL